MQIKRDMDSKSADTKLAKYISKLKMVVEEIIILSDEPIPSDGNDQKYEERFDKLSGKISDLIRKISDVTSTSDFGIKCKLEARSQFYRAFLEDIYDSYKCKESKDFLAMAIVRDLHVRYEVPYPVEDR